MSVTGDQKLTTVRMFSVISFSCCTILNLRETRRQDFLKLYVHLSLNLKVLNQKGRSRLYMFIW